MKILLIAVNMKEFYTPLALLYLKAVLLKDRYLRKKVKVEIKEFSIYNTDDFILHEIQKYNPQIIGFSCYVWNINRILTLLYDIKKINRNVKVIMGGPQVSPISKILLKQNNQIDIIVKGEGEVIFLKLIKSLLHSGKGINKISGIAYRHNGRIIDNPEGEIIADLDSIPSPYLSNALNLSDKEVCLETQRGCIFKCNFCYYNKGLDRLRFFSIERVKEDLSFLLRQKLRSIYLMDPVFNVNVDRAKEICKFIIKKNKNSVMFHTEIRAELVDEEMAELFDKANIKYLEIGLQSSKDETLRLINRKLNIKNFVNGINLLKKYDLLTEIQLIVGLPGDTLRSFKKSLKFVLDIEPKVVRVARLQVLPGTKIWCNAKKLGIIYEENPPYYFLKSSSFSFEDAIKTQKIINSLELFGDRLIIKYLCKEGEIKLLDFINLWIQWCSDDSLLLNYTDTNTLISKVQKFIKYFCRKNNIDFNFYNILLQKEKGANFWIRKGKEQWELLEKSYYGK